MCDLRNKTILITGASSGLGRAIAISSAAAGARLVLLARNEERLRETAGLCSGQGHVLRLADLENLAALPALIGHICQEVGPLSGLVHAAGAHRLVPLRATQPKHLEELMRINALAPAMLVKGLSLRGNHQAGCSVVVLSSVMGRVSKPSALGYAMSKGAVEQLVRTLALELAPLGLRINAVAPAMIDTPLTKRALAPLGDDERNRILSEHPMGLGQPEDVAAAAVFLLSDASRYVTGTALLVDGGYCAQ
jgi:NAD(P)-dependent dehydrogenase (short-subunit alcohol dehydrogenase family)